MFNTSNQIDVVGVKEKEKKLFQTRYSAVELSAENVDDVTEAMDPAATGASWGLCRCW